MSLHQYNWCLYKKGILRNVRTRGHQVRMAAGIGVMHLQQSPEATGEAGDRLSLRASPRTQQSPRFDLGTSGLRNQDSKFPG